MSIFSRWLQISFGRSDAARYSFRPPAGFIPKAVALNCGQYQIAPRRLPTDLAHLLMLDYLPKRGKPEELETIDVTAHITSRFPPVFLMTANGDFLKEQAPLLVRALEGAGVPCVYRCYGDGREQLGHVFRCNVKSRAARRCNDEECEFFMNFLSE